MPEDQNREDSPALEEGLPTPFDNASLKRSVTSQETRSSSPPKRSAAHMEDGDDVDMKETPGHEGTNTTGGDNASSSKGTSNARFSSNEPSSNDQMADGTASNSINSDPTSASAQPSSAATSLESSPFHMTATSDDRIIEDKASNTPRPSYDEQYGEVLPMLQEPPQDGDVGYLVANKWLQRVLARTSSPPADVDKDALEGEVGPIDNSSIMQTEMPEHTYSDEKGEPFIPLRAGVTEDDYTIVPSKAWDLILDWYGLASGSFPVKRYAHDTAEEDSTSTNVIYELHPPIFTIRKVRNGKDGTTLEVLQERNLAAPKLMATRSKGTQEFLKDVKQAVNVPNNVKIRLWRDLTSMNQPVPEASTRNQPGILTPPSSSGGSPRMRPQASSLKLEMDLNEFTSMTEGSDREMVDCRDETANPKYNGRSKIAILGLASDQTLIVEEQVSTTKDEYVSDALRSTAAKNGVTLNNKTTANRTTASKAGTSSGRSSPAPSGPMTRGRSQRTGRTRGTVGLINLGNSCYMNSALQCIRSVEELTQYFLLEKYKKELNTNNPLGHNGNVARAYAGLLASIYDPSAATSFAPRNFKGVLGRYAPMFSGYGQQDSQELMSFLVDGLHEDLNRIVKKPYIENPESDDKTVHDPDAIKALGQKYQDNHRARNDSIAMDLFNGFYKNTMVCPECEKVSITFDPFSLLTLQLPFQQTWQHTIDFIPLYGKPLRIEIDMDKNGTFRSLKEYIMQRVPGLDRNRLLVAEIFNNKFYKIFEDNATISESNVQPRDDIVVYELEHVPTNFPPKKKNPQKIRSMLVFNHKDSDDEMDGSDSELAEHMLVPVFNQKSGSNTYASKSLILYPFFISLTPKEAMDYDTILKKILAKVDGLTTKDIFEDDDHQYQPFTNANESANESDTVLTPEDDASSTDQAVQAQSVEGENSIIDVSMTDSHTSNSHNLHPNVFATSQRPSILQPGSFIPGQLQNLFTIRYHSVGPEIIPTGFSSFDSSSAKNIDIQSRVHQSLTDGRRSSLASTVSMSRSRSSESDIDDPPEQVNSFQTNDPTSDEELPQISTLYNQPSKKKKHGKGRKNQATYSRKGKQTSVQPSHYSAYDGADEDEDPALVRLGEVLVLDWTTDAVEALFGADKAGEMRGAEARKFAETFEDEELQEKKERRAARKKSGVTLEDCFTETSKSEVLSEENAWYCSRCKELRRAEKTLEVWTLPDILVIHLKRFGANRGFRDKIDVLVDFPVEGLDLNKRVGLKDGDKDLVYDLIAVDNHYGGLGGGHYTAFAKNFFDGQWYEYNDSQVSKRNDPDVVITSAAYLLFYRRRSDTPLGPSYLQELIADARAAENPDEVNPDTQDGTVHKSQSSSRNASPSGQGKGRPLGVSFHNGSSSASAAAGAARRPVGGPAGSGGAGKQARTEAGDAMMDEELPAYGSQEMDHAGDETLGGTIGRSSALFGPVTAEQSAFSMAATQEQNWTWGDLRRADNDADADGEADDNDSNVAEGSSTSALPDLDDNRMEEFDDSALPLNVSREVSPSVGVTHIEAVDPRMVQYVPGDTEPMSEDDPPPAEVRVGEHEELKMD
ncbi:UCH-domain-containing protein [Rhizodiscina lignyota]|uniref:ubiquitinyl hydrolase 1 n=1 Tax=Rhizodiscina lignyota TaxID=1504668 RepID=A0A9P4MAG9_9PEZI|nr:UCH-domain-containing protein [Rhizodiscina lignyota]